MIRIDPGLIPDGSHDSLMLGFACNFISFNGGMGGEGKGFDGTGSGDHLICIICLEPWLACLSGAGEVAGEGGRKEGGRGRSGAGRVTGKRTRRILAYANEKEPDSNFTNRCHCGQF